MFKNISTTIVTVIIASACFGCAQLNMADTKSQLDKNWGRSFESARYNQILNPEAEKNLEPVEGLAGPAVEKLTAGTCSPGLTQKTKE